MWVLMVFEKRGDRLLRHHELRRFTIGDMRGLWPGNDDDALRGLSFPVDARQSAAIAAFSSEPLLLDDFDYFVEYEAPGAT